MSHEAWLSQATSDLEAARLLSNAGFHCQAVWLAAQAVEKGHKAIIAALGLRYEDKHYKQLSHDTAAIVDLLPEALQEPLSPDIADKLSALTSRARTSRYPGPLQGSRLVAPAQSYSESAQDVDDATTLLDWCRIRVGRALNALAHLGP